MFKNLIDAKIKLLGITNKELAEHLSLSVSTVCAIRNDARKTKDLTYRRMDCYLTQELKNQRKKTYDDVETQTRILDRVLVSVNS